MLVEEVGALLSSSLSFGCSTSSGEDGVGESAKLCGSSTDEVSVVKPGGLLQSRYSGDDMLTGDSVPSSSSSSSGIDADRIVSLLGVLLMMSDGFCETSTGETDVLRKVVLNGDSEFGLIWSRETEVVDFSRAASGDLTLSGCGTSAWASDGTARTEAPEPSFIGDVMEVATLLSPCWAIVCMLSVLTGEVSGGVFCSLLGCRWGAFWDFDDGRSSFNDSLDVLGGVVERVDSSEIFSDSSISSSTFLLFLSFLLNKPLSMPDFFSFRFLSSLILSPELMTFSKASRLPRPFA